MKQFILLVEMMSVCEIKSSNFLGRYFSTQGKFPDSLGAMTTCFCTCYELK